MKKVVLVFLLITGIFYPLLADYQPDIYAVSLIQLRSGTSVTGVIEIAKVGECGYFPNGFATQSSRGQYQLELLSLIDHRIQPDNSTDTLFYVQNQTFGCNKDEYSRTVTLIDNTLLESTSRNNRFLLKSYLPVFMDLQMTGRPLSSSKVKIDANNIEYIQLILSPGQQWTDLIQQRRSELKKEMKNNPENWSPDLFDALWIHEMSENERYEAQQFFNS